MILARFVPQEDMQDSTQEVSTDGGVEWDATDAFSELEVEYRERLVDEMRENGQALDDFDELKGDPGAPEWIQEWTGPGTIFLRQVAAEEDGERCEWCFTRFTGKDIDGGRCLTCGTMIG